MRQYSLLVVEDDEIDRMNIERAMKKAKLNNKMYFAHDGLEALEVLPTIEEPILILLDLNMPRMNGIEFLRKLRAGTVKANAPVVVLTTSKEDKDRTEAYMLNVNGYVVKPLDFSNFVEAIAVLNSYWTLCEFPPN